MKDMISYLMCMHRLLDRKNNEIKDVLYFIYRKRKNSSKASYYTLWVSSIFKNRTVFYSWQNLTLFYLFYLNTSFRSIFYIVWSFAGKFHNCFDCMLYMPGMNHKRMTHFFFLRKHVYRLFEAPRHSFHWTSISRKDQTLHPRLAMISFVWYSCKLVLTHHLLNWKV